MNLQEMLDERLIVLDLEAKDKEDAIDKVIDVLYKAKKIKDIEKFKQGILLRESEFSTGIGRGIAIPHCMSDVVDNASFTIVKLKNEIHWESLDDKPVRLIIMLAVPKQKGDVHLKLLSQLATNLMDDEFSEGLLNATSIEDIKKVFSRGGN